MAVKTMNGKFVIKSAQFPNYALNVYSNNGVTSGQNVCLFPYSSSDLLQQWVPQAQGSNVYKISTAYPGSSRIVLDHFRTTPVNNCDMFTSAGSNDDGTPTLDLLDQQIVFDEGSDGYYTIYLNNGGKKDLVLTCASKVDNLGVGSVTSDLNVTDNVYWAKKSSSLGNRQKWKIVQLAFDPLNDTILSHAQAYVQVDPTWDYLSDPGDFARWACGVCALTTCEAIKRKSNAFTPATCRNAGGFEDGNVAAKWGIFGMGEMCNGNANAGYKTIYNQISDGNAVIIHVNNPGEGHYVAAYGYTDGTTESNITPSRILIIDPYDPDRTNLQQLLNHNSVYDSIIAYYN